MLNKMMNTAIIGIASPLLYLSIYLLEFKGGVRFI